MPPPDGTSTKPAASWCRANVNSILRGLALVLILRTAHSFFRLTSKALSSEKSPFDVMGAEFKMDLPTLTKTQQLSSTSINEPDDDLVPSNDGFGACLLIKEDNHRLDEWIAYHLVVLPLRYLIVAIDPLSGQSPLPLLKKWNGTLGMFIDTWSDGDWIPGDSWGEKLCNQWHNLNVFKNYLGRQQSFMKSCAQQMERSNMTWVSFIDSDEFWVFNHIEEDGNESLTVRGQLAESKAPDHRQRLPASLGEGITIFEFLNNWTEHQYPETPCYVAPRLLFSAVESTTDERLRSNHTDLGFDNVTHFNTLRFFRHAGRRAGDAILSNNDGKPVVDVSRLKGLRRPGWGFRNPHYPMPGGVCGDRRFHVNNHGQHHFQSALRVNHYVGSKEDYFARHDHRRSNEQFLEKAGKKVGVSYTTLPWLGLFVKRVGSVAMAKELLGDAGIIVPFEPVDLCKGNRANVSSPMAPFFFPSNRGGQWAH